MVLNAPAATALLLTLTVTAGCVVDAPEDMEELVTYGFAHFEDEPRFLRATTANLVPLVDESFDEITEGWRVDNLTSDHLAAAGVDVEGDLHILGAMGAADYRHTLDEVLPAIIHPDKASVFDSYLEYRVFDETDRDCFLDRSCEAYRFSFEQRTEASLLGEAASSGTKHYRWVEPEDGGPAFVVGRSLLPDPIEFTTDLMEVFQQYDFVLLYPHGDAVRRSETFWVDALLNDDDIPDYFAVEAAAAHMRTQAGRIDDFLDAEDAR